MWSMIRQAEFYGRCYRGCIVADVSGGGGGL